MLSNYNSPLISVLMPAYNCENYIKMAIESILNQTYKNFELLIADDASTDGTRNIINSYTDARIKWLHNDINLGYLKTTNLLLSAATGEYICFQDADDYCDNNKIELQIQTLIEYNLDACGTSFYRIDRRNNIISESNIPLELDLLRKTDPPNAPFCTSSFMICRKIYEEIGGYHEFFDRCGGEDVYWAYSIVDNYNFVNLKNKLYYYRYTDNSITYSVPKNLKGLLISPISTFLIQERRKGNNILSSKKYNELNKYIEKLEKPFKDDPNLFTKEQMIRCFWLEQYRRGFKLAFRVIFTNPFQNKEFYKNLYMYLTKWAKGIAAHK